MTTLRIGLAFLFAATLAGCDEISALMTEVSEKGGETDVPAEAREPIDAETTRALRTRIQGQNFN